VKTASEMTYIVSSGALNSTPTNQGYNGGKTSVILQTCIVASECRQKSTEFHGRICILSLESKMNGGAAKSYSDIISITVKHVHSLMTGVDGSKTLCLVRDYL